MATYVMSDLHGCKQEFDEMLKQIAFSEYDTLWIIGDICDRGKESIPLLQEIMAYPNMHIICGNHDAWFIKYCSALIEAKQNNGTMDMSDDLFIWLHRNGGFSTADQFMDLPFPNCYDIKCYLENIPYYKQLEIHGKKYLLVHAGIPADYTGNCPRPSEVKKEILIWSHIGIDDNPYEDTTMIVGHSPTFLYGKEYDGKILIGKNESIFHIDCGCVFGRTLGCLRLEDKKEFYIKSTYPYLQV